MDPTSLRRLAAVLSVGLAALSLALNGAAAPLVEYREYPSSQDTTLRLFARFACADKGPLVVLVHGWHGSVKTAKLPEAHLRFNPAEDRDFFVVQPEMRGRGDATGRPDASGWEIQDIVDAVAFARATYPDRIVQPERVLIHGGSGGGGNTYALLGKYPDFFAAAVVSCGMSDYGLWHRFDALGEFRDEMEGIATAENSRKIAWIGGTPDTRREAYDSRGGLTTVRNLLTPTMVLHGDGDIAVPVAHARLWVGAALGLGKGGLVRYAELTGVGGKGHFDHETSERTAWRLNAIDVFLHEKHPGPPVLPSRSVLAIGGFVKTKKFEVIFDSIDQVGQVSYDLDEGRFDVSARTAASATLRTLRPDGQWRTQRVACRTQ